MIDVNLFAWVVDHMQHGWSYYDAMGQAIRNINHPAASVFNWRPPLVYWLLALWPTTIPLTWWGMLLLFTEAWAGVAIVASILASRSNAVVSAVLAGLELACRELALPFFLVLLLFNARRAPYTWGAVIVACGAYYIWHVVQVTLHRQPSDLVPPPWIVFGGLHFVRRTLSLSPTAWVFGYVVGGWIWFALLTLALFSSRVPIESRVVVVVYLALFCVAGDPNPVHDNGYWGLLTLPLQTLVISQAGAGVVRYTTSN